MQKNAARWAKLAIQLSRQVYRSKRHCAICLCINQISNPVQMLVRIFVVIMQLWNCKVYHPFFQNMGLKAFSILLILLNKASHLIRRPSPEAPHVYFHMWTHGTIIKELLLTTRKLMALKSREKKSLYSFRQLFHKKGFCSSVMIKNIPGHALGIWIWGCSSCSIEESSGPQNLRVQKVMFQRSTGLCTPLHPC